MLRSGESEFLKGRSRKFWKLGIGVGSRKFRKVGFGYFTSDSATLFPNTPFMSKYCQYTIYQWNFAHTMLWQHRKIHRSISSLKGKCGFMLKSDIKSCPSATDPFFRLDAPLIPMYSTPTIHGKMLQLTGALKEKVSQFFPISVF